MLIVTYIFYGKATEVLKNYHIFHLIICLRSSFGMPALKDHS